MPRFPAKIGYWISGEGLGLVKSLQPSITTHAHSEREKRGKEEEKGREEGGGVLKDASNKLLHH